MNNWFKILIGIFCIVSAVPEAFFRAAYSQSQRTDAPAGFENRDPFIPLVDDRGQIRTNFQKPSLDTLIPQVTLLGISKVGDIFYALIDGELLKEGHVFKGLKIESITEEKVTVSYGDRQFDLSGKKEEK